MLTPEMSKLILIDRDKCDGCGLCVDACHEGALAMVDGKAALVRESLCDGLGACLPACPRGAITLLDAAPSVPAHPAGCPGSRERVLAPRPRVAAPDPLDTASALTHWPVQLALISPRAPFLRGADLLLCADCVPFAVPDFHARYLAGRAVLVGCPKLDDLGAYAAKLAEIFAEARPSSVTVLRMEVPCCGALATIAERARDAVMPELAIDVQVIGIQGGAVPARPAAARGSGRLPVVGG